MNTEELISAKIKELKGFVNKQIKDSKTIEAEMQKQIAIIPDEKVKAQLNQMMNDAKAGNIENVQRIAEMLQKNI